MSTNAMGSSGLIMPGMEELLGTQNEGRKRTLVLVVHSTKGGVGKTTISKNLAHAFLSLSLSVVIMDANTDGNVAEQMGASFTNTLDHWHYMKGDLEEATLKQYLGRDQFGVYVLASGSLPIIKKEAIERAMNNLIKYFDVIIVDTETKLGGTILPTLEYADRAILVGNDNPSMYPRLQFRFQQFQQIDKIKLHNVDLILNRNMNIAQTKSRDIENTLQRKITREFDYEELVKRTETDRRSTYFDARKSKFAKNMRQYALSICDAHNISYTLPKKKRFFHAKPAPMTPRQYASAPNQNYTGW